MLVIRTQGTEEYTKKKVRANTAKAMERAGLISRYNSTFGYIEGEYKETCFEFKGKHYKVEYFSGCFHPFLLQLIMITAEFKVKQAAKDWDETPVIDTLLMPKGADDAFYRARRISKEHGNKEVRYNYEGQLQGYYVVNTM